MIKASCHCGAVHRAFDGIAVNLRLADPEAVATIRADQFDGLTTWQDLPPTGKCISDMRSQ